MTPKFAISYLRVSTQGQAECGGGADEGFSIPAQREANKHKAHSLGAFLGKEFVDRGDDIDITRALQEANVQLVSTSESIGDTPAGMLLHGIMSSIAEFYSRNLSTEVKKGMGEKVRAGGIAACNLIRNALR